MKVVFITREGNNLSGARVRCYNFAREVEKYGIDAQVFSFGDHLGARYGENELRMSAFEKCILNHKAFRVLWNLDCDTVFVVQRMNYHALPPVFISLIKKNKIIFDCDDWNIREDPLYYLGAYPSSKMEYFTRSLARHSCACIAASSFLYQYLLRFNPRTYYIPTGVDTDLFRSKITPNEAKVTFSWIGTAYHKEMGENIRFLLSCFSSIADHNDQVFLSLAGQGKYFDEIKSEINVYKHRSKVEFRSWIAPDSIPDYLSSIDVGLLPLIQETKFNKAKSPTKLFEYMSMEKATISSAMGEASNIIKNRETGLLASNKEEFISAMQLLIGNQALRDSIGCRARQEVQMRYSLKVLGGRLAEIIRGV